MASGLKSSVRADDRNVDGGLCIREAKGGVRMLQRSSAAVVLILMKTRSMGIENWT